MGASKKKPLTSVVSPTDVPTSPSEQESEPVVRNSSRKSAQVIEIVSQMPQNLNRTYLIQSKSDLTEEIDEKQTAAPLGKRVSTPRIDKFFHYTNKAHCSQSEDSDFIEKRPKKRLKKAQGKKVQQPKEETVVENEKRKVPTGVSVFDLIMPWKTEIVQQDTTNLIKDGIAKMVTCSGKSKVLDLNLSDHAENVQAILMNPPWENSYSSEKQPKKISIEDFKKSFDIPTSVMKDGLVFIWVEKEFIFDLIKCFEKQDFFYVENVCYVMLD